MNINEMSVGLVIWQILMLILFCFVIYFLYKIYQKVK